MTPAPEAGGGRDLFAVRREPTRSPLAAAVSLVMHGSLVVLLGVVALREVITPEANGRPPMRFVNMAAPPAVPIEMVLPPVPPPEPEPVEVEVELPEPPPEPKIEPVIIETPKAPEPPTPPKPEPVVPKPEVKVGAFADNRPAAVATQPPRQVQTTSFDTPQAVAPDMRLKTTTTGTFDAGNDMAARLGTDKPKGVVTGTGFDQKAAAATPGTGRTLSATGGFDSAKQAASATPTVQAVQSSGFGDAKPQTQQARAAAVAPTTTAVEVLFKPSPGYTAEARERRVQGDVVLEVEFAASGSLKVLRVVRGLGYGLDELATEAARQIKFKPALQGGKPVDFRANVVIVFRLS